MAAGNAKRSSFWRPILLSLPLTLFLFIIAAAPCGVGHGNCRLFVIFFPLMMVSDVFGAMPSSAFVLAIIQFPLYGLILGVAARRGIIKVALLALFGIHILAVIMIFLVFG